MFRRWKAHVGKNKMEDIPVWSLAYADDIVLIAKKGEELKAKMKRLEYFIDGRKLNLNVEKSKTMAFKKGGRKEKTRSRNEKVKG